MFNVLVIFGFLFVSPRISLLKTSRWSSTIYQENYIIIIPFLFLEVVRGGVFISRIVYFPFFGLSLEKRRKNCVCDVLLLSLSLMSLLCVIIHSCRTIAKDNLLSLSSLSLWIFYVSSFFSHSTLPTWSVPICSLRSVIDESSDLHIPTHAPPLGSSMSKGGKVITRSITRISPSKYIASERDQQWGNGISTFISMSGPMGDEKKKVLINNWSRRRAVFCRFLNINDADYAARRGTFREIPL